MILENMRNMKAEMEDMLNRTNDLDSESHLIYLIGSFDTIMTSIVKARRQQLKNPM